LPELLWAALAAAGGLLFGTVGAGFACALRPAATPGTGFAPPAFFTPTELVPTWVGEDFTGVTTATPRDLAGACVALTAAGADWCMPRASFEAAVALLLTPFMVLRVFWIMLGLWAEAKPAASTQTKIVVVVANAGFIMSLLFLHRWSGLAGRPRRIQIMTEIRRGQAGRHHTLTRRVLVGMLRLGIARLAGRGHQQVRDVYDALHFSQPVEEPKHRVVRTVELNFKRHFRVEIFRDVWTRSIAPDFHSRLARFSAHHAHEIVHFFFIGHDAPLDFQLLLQAGELTLDVGQFRPVGFEFRVLTQFGLQLDLGRRIFIALRLEDRVVE